MTPETKLQKEIQKYLKYNYPGTFIFKVHGNKFQKSGIPDLMIIIKGITIFCETKIYPNKESAVQKSVREEIWQANGISIVVYSVEEFTEVLAVLFKKLNKKYQNLYEEKVLEINYFARKLAQKNY